MKKSLFLPLFLMAFGVSGVAQNRGSSSEGIQQDLSKKYPGSLILGLKSYSDTSRIDQSTDSKNYNLKSKNEVQLGYTFENDWSLYGQAVEYAKEYRNGAQNRWDYGDPSLTIAHAAFLKTPTTTITGSYRQYFPTTKRSEGLNLYQSAYYFSIVQQLNAKDEIFNQLIPRYFFQSGYQTDDTTFYAEDRTIFHHRFTKEFRASIGHWTQYELHSGTPNGVSVEIVPQCDYFLTPKVFFGPRISIPVVAKDAVYEGPRAVATDQIYGELYLQAAL